MTIVWMIRNWCWIIHCKRLKIYIQKYVISLFLRARVCESKYLVWTDRAKIFNPFRQMFTIIVPTPLEGGGNYILKWVFFVQSILADRYFHHRELRLVSLESLSSVEYGIKKIFLIFVFDREISRFKLSRKKCEFRWFHSLFFGVFD